jgi:excisionase family DNA binding protein
MMQPQAAPTGPQGQDRRGEERSRLMDKERYHADPPQEEEGLRTKLLSDKEEDEDWYSWLTTQEAATLSGYDIQHVRRLAREGKIGAVKRGRDWWIDYEMFMAF